MDEESPQRQFPPAPEPTIPLPGVITAIRRQRRNERYNIYVDNTFLIGISEEVLCDMQLKKGDKLPIKEYYQIFKQEYIHKLRGYILRLLGRREYSRFELFRRTQQKGYHKKFVNPILDELEQKKLIDDHRYANAFVRDKFNINRWGPGKIKTKLYANGISKSVAERAVNHQISREDMEKTCSDLLHKKRLRFNREKNSVSRKQKMLRYLAGRGFPSEICFEVVSKVLK